MTVQEVSTTDLYQAVQAPNIRLQFHDSRGAGAHPGARPVYALAQPG